MTTDYKKLYIEYRDKFEEYHNKYWKGYHTNKNLTKENRKLKLRVDIYEKKILYGKIKRISSHYDYGILTNSEYGDIFFHNSQCNFNISNHLLGKKLKFNMIINKRLEANNIELDIEDSLSGFDILESGIYKSNDLQIDNISDDSSSESSSESFVSANSFDSENTSDINYNSTNMLLNTGLNNNILPEDDYEEDLKIIHNTRRIWYMNCRLDFNNKDHVNRWNNQIDNGFIGTWQTPTVNQKIFNKLNIGDIIAWYVVGQGYSAILRIKENCSVMNKDDLKIHFPEKSDEDINSHLEWEKRENSCIIKIPVEFLSYTKLDKCVKRFVGWSKEDWTSGYRGSNSILPKNPRWKEQVMKMYKKMK